MFIVCALASLRAIKFTRSVFFHIKSMCRHRNRNRITYVIWLFGLVSSCIFIQCAIPFSSEIGRIPIQRHAVTTVQTNGKPHESDLVLLLWTLSTNPLTSPWISIVCHFHLMMRFVARRLIKYVYTNTHTHRLQTHTQTACRGLSNQCAAAHISVFTVYLHQHGENWSECVANSIWNHSSKYVWACFSFIYPQTQTFVRLNDMRLYAQTKLEWNGKSNKIVCMWKR